ncbi:MAG: hypothetical protein LBN97_03560 [Oscillospiraceae bacterium]|jgi:hypothetical protein|nr:hypothetical protein [Oscillospiraceae bacterium]
MGIERIQPGAPVVPVAPVTAPERTLTPPAAAASRTPLSALDWDKRIGPPYIDDVSDEAKAEATSRLEKQAACETCRNRKYKDGSDDPSVSFQTPTKIAPENAARAVAGHEREHVAHEQADAKREDREVVSQSVTIHTSVCPDCGRVYVSGGTTRTATRDKQESPNPDVTNNREEQNNAELGV